MKAMNINMKRDVMSGLTLEVRATGIRAMRVRLWLGARLIALATKIIGCKTFTVDFKQ